VRLLATLALALLFAAPAGASERHPTLGELEGEVMCPVCKTTLDQSSSPAARQIERLIAGWIAHGKTKSQIEALLVANYGPAILTEPSRHGFNLLVWVLPLAGLGLGAVALGALSWRWSRGREGATAADFGPALDPELDRRVEEELTRFDG
jgi:cytochrome c-type biogenesis protein CcmH/NrfF